MLLVFNSNIWVLCLGFLCLWRKTENSQNQEDNPSLKIHQFPATKHCQHNFNVLSLSAVHVLLTLSKKWYFWVVSSSYNKKWVYLQTGTRWPSGNFSKALNLNYVLLSYLLCRTIISLKVLSSVIRKFSLFMDIEFYDLEVLKFLLQSNLSKTTTLGPRKSGRLEQVVIL